MDHQNLPPSSIDIESVNKTDGMMTKFSLTGSLKHYSQQIRTKTKRVWNSSAITIEAKWDSGLMATELAPKISDL